MDFVETPAHQQGQIMHSVDRLNGFMNREGDVPVEGDFLEARHNIEGTVDGYGYYRQTEFNGKPIGSALELTHLAVPGARPFREHHERHAALKLPFSLFEGFACCRRGGVVDHYVTRHLAGVAYQRDFFERFLHHPPELVVEIAVDGKYIIGALMVGDKDIGGIGVDILPANDRYPHKGERAKQARPPMREKVSCPPSHTDHTEHYRQRGSEDCGDQQEGRHYQKLIYAIQDQFHGIEINMRTWDSSPS